MDNSLLSRAEILAALSSSGGDWQYVQYQFSYWSAETIDRWLAAYYRPTEGAELDAAARARLAKSIAHELILERAGQRGERDE